MRKITKLMFALAMFAGGVTSANAQEADDVTIDLTGDLFYNWDGYGADASYTSKATVEDHIGEELTSGGYALVIGTSTVAHLIYADFTGCSKMLFEGTPGLTLRVLMNRQENSTNGPLVEKNPKIGDDGKAELDLTEFSYVHLNAIKTVWDAKGTITSIKLVKPSDPLAVPKETLTKAIALAKMQNPVAKTADSFGKLTKAIEEAQKVLGEAKTADELTAATQLVNEAIEGLELATGYTNLTKGMYNYPYGAYAVNESTGLPYGDGNVAMGNYADLSGYDQLIIAVAAGAPRFCINRTTAAGQDNADENLSEMIDIPGQAWGTSRYQTVSEDSKVFTINLAKIVEEKGFAYLHSIKGSGGNVTVTGMYLYREATNVTLNKDNGTGYCTFASRYPTTWPVSGITAYKATVENGEVSFTEVKGDVPSNTGLLLKAADAEYTINIPETVPAAVENNALVGVLKDTTIEKDGIFVLYKKGENVGFYKTTAAFTVGANTAYIPAAVSAGARTFIALPGNEATGVKAIEAVEADGKFYDLQGRQVSNPTKGLYISNGKKFVVK